MSDLPTLTTTCPDVDIALGDSIAINNEGDDSLLAGVDDSNNLLASPSTPGVVDSQPADITVDNTAGGVQLLAANADRKAAIIQNTGGENIRVGIGTTPTAATGIQLAPGQVLHLSMPYCPTEQIKGIQEGASSSTAAVIEIV